MINTGQEFAIVISAAVGLRCSVIYGFSDRELAEEAAVAINAQLSVLSDDILIIQTKRGFGE